jgi:hypothetical protein
MSASRRDRKVGHVSVFGLEQREVVGDQREVALAIRERSNVANAEGEVSNHGLLTGAGNDDQDKPNAVVDAREQELLVLELVQAGERSCSVQLLEVGLRRVVRRKPWRRYEPSLPRGLSTDRLCSANSA